MWENLDSIPLNELPVRHVGPPTLASGTGFFESFLPLMAILGDIIELHHRRHHPRLSGLDDMHSVMVISKLLADFELSLNNLGGDAPLRGFSDMPMGMNGGLPPMDSNHSRIRLVKAYSTHILHVLHVLLHGKWDAISMLDDGDDWITSKRFTECASHAISASQSVSTILTIDPELTFMSYLFGIYLLQGSFILLLFADRMPQLGPNESVEQACENIIRAHEVCVVTLSTEFQVGFRQLLDDTNTQLTFDRKIFGAWCDRRCTRYVERARRIWKSTGLGAGRYRSIDGQRARGDWACNIDTHLKYAPTSIYT